jgi:serine/threonine-protein kinase RsbW
MHIKIVMTLPPEAASVPLVRRTVAEAMRSAGVAGDCVEEASVALSEACTNVYHHAEAEDHYEVVITLESERLTMDILDSGNGFNGQLHQPTMPDSTAENGRGLALMAAFSDQVVFDSVLHDGGSVHLMKRLRWANGAPTVAADAAS